MFFKINRRALVIPASHRRGAQVRVLSRPPFHDSVASTCEQGSRKTTLAFDFKPLASGQRNINLAEEIRNVASGEENAQDARHRTTLRQRASQATARQSHGVHRRRSRRFAQRLEEAI